MASGTTAVKWAIIIWSLALSSVAQATLPYQYRPHVPSKTREDASVDQLSRTLKANHVDLHDSSSPPARTIAAISGDQDEINAANRRIVELPFNMNTSVVLGEPESDSKDSEDFWAWKQLPQSEDIMMQPEIDRTSGHLFPDSEARPDECPHCMPVTVVSANPDSFSYGDPFYGDIFSANAEGPGSMSADMFHVPSSHGSPSDAAVARYVYLPGNTGSGLENDELEERVEIIPLPEIEVHNTKSDFQNVRFPQMDNIILPYDLHRLPYATGHIKHNQRSHHHYGVGNSDIAENNELASDVQDVNTNTDNDKRKFDSISDISSFGGFGKRQDKRKFDSISDISSFGGFGKRQDKRKFDSISDISSFGGFGKRQDKRKFDSISDISSFGGFGKRQDKRKFDSISDISSFGGFGKRQDKRKFDSISDISSFGGFGKRQDKRKFDSISDISSFGGFGKRQDKRKFDSISDISSFGGFGKRQDKRNFDYISDISPFGGFGKRQDKRKFDSISDISSFGGFGKRQDKRKFDSISDTSSFGGFGKRQDKRKFDSISDISSFGGFGKRHDKRKFNPVSEVSYFGRFDKRSAPDNMEFDSHFGNGKAEETRKFDSISGVSSFGQFGKRELGEQENILSTSAVSSVGTVDTSLEKEDNRKFDSISGFSSFGNFEKRQEQEHRPFGTMPKVVSFRGFDDGRFDPTSGLSWLSGPGSRGPQTESTFDAISLVGPLGEFGKHERKEKRKFDSISGVSSFGRFNRRQNADRTKFTSISGYSSFGNMAAENNGLYFNPDVRSFEKIKDSTVDGNKDIPNPDVKGAVMANHYDKSAAVANQVEKSATIGSLADKSAVMYRKKRDVSEYVYKDMRIKQRNVSQREDTYNTLFAETNDLENTDEVNGERNHESNNEDSEDFDAGIKNSYSSVNSLDNALTPDGGQLSPVYSNGPLTFSVRKLDPTGGGDIFVVLGKQRLARQRYNNKSQQYSQSSNKISKRRFDRISTQGNIFRSFGKRSAASVASRFDELHKRHFDRISDTSQFARFGRDVLHHVDYVPPSEMGTNIFDMALPNVVNRWAKRQYHDTFNNHPLTGFTKGYAVNGGFMGKRRFDSIDHNSPFRMFTKKRSDNNHFAMAELDSEPVVIRNSYSFPELHKQTPELLILHSLPHAAQHGKQGVFWEPRVHKRHFDSIGHSSMFQRFGRHSNNRWS